MSSRRETHFTPKGVSICSGPTAINMQPLRGWWKGSGPTAINSETTTWLVGRYSRNSELGTVLVTTQDDEVTTLGQRNATMTNAVGVG